MARALTLAEERLLRVRESGGRTTLAQECGRDLRSYLLMLQKQKRYFVGAAADLGYNLDMTPRQVYAAVRWVRDNAEAWTIPYIPRAGDEAMHYVVVQNGVQIVGDVEKRVIEVGTQQRRRELHGSSRRLHTQAQMMLRVDKDDAYAARLALALGDIIELGEDLG